MLEPTIPNRHRLLPTLEGINTARDIDGKFIWRLGAEEFMRDLGENIPAMIERKVLESRVKMFRERRSAPASYFYTRTVFLRDGSDIVDGLRRAYAVPVGRASVRMKVSMLYVNYQHATATGKHDKIQVQHRDDSTLYNLRGTGVEQETTFSPIDGNDLLRTLTEGELFPNVNYYSPVFDQLSNKDPITTFLIVRLNARLEAGVHMLNSGWQNLGVHTMIIQMSTTDRLTRASNRFIGLIGRADRPCDSDAIGRNLSARQRRAALSRSCASDNSALARSRHNQPSGRPPDRPLRQFDVDEQLTAVREIANRAYRPYNGGPLFTGGRGPSGDTPPFKNIKKLEGAIHKIQTRKDRMLCVHEACAFLIGREDNPKVRPSEAAANELLSGFVNYMELLEECEFDDFLSGFDLADAELLQHYADYLTSLTGKFRQIVVYMYRDEDLESQVYSGSLQATFITAYPSDDDGKIYSLLTGSDEVDLCTPSSSRLITTTRLVGKKGKGGKAGAPMSPTAFSRLKEHDILADASQMNMHTSLHLLWYNEHVHAVTKPELACCSTWCLKCSRVFTSESASDRRDALAAHVARGCGGPAHEVKCVYPRQREAFSSASSIIRHLMGKPKRAIALDGLHNAPIDLTFLLPFYVYTDFESMMRMVAPQTQTVKGEEIPRATQITAIHMPLRVGIMTNMPDEDFISVRRANESAGAERDFFDKWLATIEDFARAIVPKHRELFKELLDRDLPPDERRMLENRLKTVVVAGHNLGGYDLLLAHDSMIMRFIRLHKLNPVVVEEADDNGGESSEEEEEVVVTRKKARKGSRPANDLTALQKARAKVKERKKRQREKAKAEAPPDMNTLVKVIKKGKRFIELRLTYKDFILSFRDVVNLFPSSLKDMIELFCKDDTEARKGVFPYEKCSNFSFLEKSYSLGTPYPLTVDDHWNDFTGRNLLDEEGRVPGTTPEEVRVNSTLAIPGIAIAYERQCKVWTGKKMTSMNDLLDWYLELDVRPAVQALDALRTLHSRGGFDILYDCLTIASIAQHTTTHYISAQSGMWENPEFIKRAAFMKNRGPTSHAPPKFVTNKLVDAVTKMYQECTKSRKLAKDRKCTTGRKVQAQFGKQCVDGSIDGYRTYGYIFYECHAKKMLGDLCRKAKEAALKRARGSYSDVEGVEGSGAEHVPFAVGVDAKSEFVFSVIDALFHQKKMCSVCLKDVSTVELVRPAVEGAFVPIPIDISTAMCVGNLEIVCLGCATSRLTYRKELRVDTEESRRLVHWAGDKIIQLTTDPEIHDLFARNQVGGPSMPYSIHPKANVTTNLLNQIIVTLVSLDANSLYPSVMATPYQPCGTPKLIKYPLGSMVEGSQALTSFTAKVLAGAIFGAVECALFLTPADEEPPGSEEWHKIFHQMHPFYLSASIPETVEVLGEHTMKRFRKKGEPNNGKPIAKEKGGAKTLVNVTRGKGLFLTPVLKWYLERGVKILNIYNFLEMKAGDCFTGFVRGGVNTRRFADESASNAPLGDVAKRLLNSSYGKTAERIADHLETKYCLNERSLCKHMGAPSFVGEESFKLDEEAGGGNAYVFKKKKKECKINTPNHVAFVVYQLAKLRMLQFFVDFIQKFSGPLVVRLNYMDTDSLNMSWPNGRDFESVVIPSMLEEYHKAKRNEIIPSVQEGVVEIWNYLDGKEFGDDIWATCLKDFMQQSKVSEALLILAPTLSTVPDEDKPNSPIIFKLSGMFLNFIGKEPGLFKLEYTGDEGYFVSSKCYNMTFEGADGYNGGETYKTFNIKQTSGEVLAASLIDDSIELIKKVQGPSTKYGGKGISRKHNAGLLADKEMFRQALYEGVVHSAENHTFQYKAGVNERHVVTQTTHKNPISCLCKKKKIADDGVTCDPLYLQTMEEFREQAAYPGDTPPLDPQEEQDKADARNKHIAIALNLAKSALNKHPDTCAADSGVKRVFKPFIEGEDEEEEEDEDDDDEGDYSEDIGFENEYC